MPQTLSVAMRILNSAVSRKPRNWSRSIWHVLPPRRRVRYLSLHPSRVRIVIRHRWCTVYIILAGLLWLGESVASAQAPAPAGPGAAPTAQSVEGLVRPETVAMHKAATQTRLEALERLLLSPEEAEALRATLEQHLKILTALETAFQKRVTYITQLGSLQRHVEE